MALMLLSISIVLLVLGYRFYGSFVARRLGVDNSIKTPAHTMNDGVDYSPAKRLVLFGHHFASIAGAAPIVGPIVALTFGWLPAFLWIVFGGIFLGAVHDFSALVASIRHHGRSIGEVIGINVGYKARQLFLVFLWATLILIIAVFIVIVAKTFVAEPEAGTASILFILLAVVFGFSVYRMKASLLISSLVGVALLAVCMFVGWYYPLELSFNTWIWILIGYIFVASVTPVWILLQPRDYLNSFLLYAVLIAGIVGVFFNAPALQAPAFTHFIDPELGPIFPILFVTIACGAISGFHSIVASGTTAKQLDNEADAKAIGYGGMLVESLVAVLAIICAAMISHGEYSATLKSAGPVAIFSNGIGSLLVKFGIPAAKGSSFVALAVSAFVLTSLDTATRLARFAFQEFFAPKTEEGKRNILSSNRFIGTAVTVAVGGLLAFSGKWKAIWPIFGAANQLLAALAFLAISAWLVKRGLKSGFLKIPMIIMFVITLSALVMLVWGNLAKGNIALAVVGVILLIIAAFLVIEAFFVKSK